MKKLLLLLSSALVGFAYAGDWSSYNITVNQHKLHYYQSGSGKPIFLLTGYATTANFWNKSFVNCLAKEHTVYLVDYWGINTSDDIAGNKTIKGMADDSYALSQALHAKKPVFIGWSMGGAVAQQISYSYPEEVSKVVLISPLTINNQPPADTGDEDEIIKPLRTYNDVLNYVFDNNLYNYKPKQLSFYKNGLFEPKEKLFPSSRISANQSMAMSLWASDPATKNMAKSSEAKYLFMVPLEDKMLLPKKTLADAKLYQHATIVQFEGSGHNISTQAPDDACNQIENFIN